MPLHFLSFRAQVGARASIRRPLAGWRSADAVNPSLGILANCSCHPWRDASGSNWPQSCHPWQAVRPSRSCASCRLCRSGPTLSRTPAERHPARGRLTLCLSSFIVHAAKRSCGISLTKRKPLGLTAAIPSRRKKQYDSAPEAFQCSPATTRTPHERRQGPDRDAGRLRH